MKWFGVLLLVVPLSLWAQCDLATFPWECNLQPKLNPGKNLVLAFCNGTPVYLTKQQQKILKRYRNAYVNMVLKVNDEYFTGPCQLAEQ
ncbi:hypothetical protein [Legionella sp. W05-934-2]|jgi:hypothetical protein|uniref:hypothetical protein n=1 Tax=Legionella sp. W05-934-2 TaxID=1198649 RepID=UPI003463844A